MAKEGPGDRRTPRQERSRATVEAIVEAGARIFGSAGYAGASTNRIAAAAGVSVGSLYEYFPNKDAILVAVAERHLDRMLEHVEAELVPHGAEAASLDQRLRAFALAMLEAHERDAELHRLIFAEGPHPDALHACVLRMEERLAHGLEVYIEAAGTAVPDADAAAHLVVQCVEVLTHRFAHRGLHELTREAFLAEVLALLRGYLAFER